MAQRSFGASLENGSNSRRRQHFSANEQRMHTALLAAAELVNATARVGCGPPVPAKKHAPSMAALERLTRELGALGYV